MSIALNATRLSAYLKIARRVSLFQKLNFDGTKLPLVYGAPSIRN